MIKEISIGELEKYRELIEDYNQINDEKFHKRYPNLIQTDLMKVYKERMEKGSKLFVINYDAYSSIIGTVGYCFIHVRTSLEEIWRQKYEKKLLHFTLEKLKKNDYITLLGPHTDTLLKLAHEQDFVTIRMDTYEINLNYPIVQTNLEEDEKIIPYSDKFKPDIIRLIKQQLSGNTPSAIIYGRSVTMKGGKERYLHWLLTSEDRRFDENISSIITKNDKVIGYCIVQTYKMDFYPKDLKEGGEEHTYINSCYIDQQFDDQEYKHKLVSYILLKIKEKADIKAVRLAIEMNDNETMEIYSKYGVEKIHEGDTWYIRKN
ncbi:MAG: hypothetical protein INQ03_21795 [Candidatus Heimdallarchaeota archaeon]|nr:hypothetical protein [Candidatus Heimdallarchaeota archaeon]